MMPAVIDPQSHYHENCECFRGYSNKKICERDPFHLNSALQFSSSTAHTVVDNCTAQQGHVCPPLRKMSTRSNTAEVFRKTQGWRKNNF